MTQRKVADDLIVGDKIMISDVNKVVEKFLHDNLFKSPKMSYLRLICALKEKKFYKVIDICHGCFTVTIKGEKSNHVIHYSHIGKIK